jgi:hypothetical protein
MALRIRFQYPTGSKLGYSIERLNDGLLYDSSNSTFVATPSTLISPLPEDSGSFIGRYKATLTSTPAAQFTNGDYVVTVHDLANSDAVVAELGATFYAGNDATVIPQPIGTAIDPWSVSLPGSYAAGSAGAILGTNLNATVSSRSTYSGGAVAGVTAPVTVGTNNDKSGYALSSTGLNAITLTSGINAAQALGKLDAAVSTRSTYAGGPVASVTSPVTVGVNNDKSGYILGSSGLDAIIIETGVNPRQALSAILAWAAGVISGAGTGTLVIKGAKTSTTRMVESVDNAGNRSSVTLTLPT